MRALQKIKKTQPKNFLPPKKNKPGFGIFAKTRLAVGERHPALTACARAALTDDHRMDRDLCGMSETRQ
jgi:hypothetical protein